MFCKRDRNLTQTELDGNAANWNSGRGKESNCRAIVSSVIPSQGDLAAEARWWLRILDPGSLISRGSCGVAENCDLPRKISHAVWSRKMKEQACENVARIAAWNLSRSRRFSARLAVIPC